MRLDRTAAGLGLVALVVIGGFMFLQLTRKAQAAYTNRQVSAAAATDASPPASAGWRQVLFFDHGTAPAGALGEGWSTPEPGSGVWSNAQRTTLQLPPSPYPGSIDVALTVEPFVIPARPFQRVRARAGARTLGEWRLTSAGITTLHVGVPAELRGPAGDLQLQLDLPDAASPAKLMKDVMDTRLLAIRLHRIAITG